jgi:RNase H-fold protein (predicted Holliday junction resolvase)
MDMMNKTPLPLGYLTNTGDVYFELSALVMKYQIDTIVCGSPSGNISVVDKIASFIINLKLCVPDTVKFDFIDEHYSSTQASDRTNDLDHKHISQDTVSAMIILERWLKMSEDKN